MKKVGIIMLVLILIGVALFAINEINVNIRNKKINKRILDKNKIISILEKYNIEIIKEEDITKLFLAEDFEECYKYYLSNGYNLEFVNRKNIKLYKNIRLLKENYGLEPIDMLKHEYYEEIIEYVFEEKNVNNEIQKELNEVINNKQIEKNRYKNLDFWENRIINIEIEEKFEKYELKISYGRS